MDKFVYSIFYPEDANISQEVTIQTIMADDIEDAQERIRADFWDLYADLEEEEWDDFVKELYTNYGICISEIHYLDEL